jgi:hypothetical protein
MPVKQLVVFLAQVAPMLLPRPRFGIALEQAATSGTQSVRKVAVGDLPACFVHSTFGSALSVAARGHSEVILCECEGERLAFTDHGRFARLTDQTIALSGQTAKRMAHILIDRYGFDYVLFDSVIIDGPTGVGVIKLHSRSNWVAKVNRTIPAGIRRKIRRLEREMGDVQFTVTLAGAEHRALFEQIIGWNKDRVEGNGRTYALIGAEREWLWSVLQAGGMIALLTVNGQNIAGALLTCDHDITVLHAMGHNPDFDRYSPGLQVLGHIRAAQSDWGGRELHLLWGDRRHKLDCGASPVPLVTAFVLTGPAAFAKAHVLAALARELWQSLRTALRYAIRGRPGRTS